MHTGGIECYIEDLGIVDPELVFMLLSDVDW